MTSPYLKSSDTLEFTTRRSAQSGTSIPSSSTTLSEVLFAKDSPLYNNLDEVKYPHSRIYVNAMTTMFDEWTGALLDKIGYKWWGWEREFEGDDGYMSAGYDQVIDWLEKEIKQKGGEIRLGEEVTEVELKLVGEDDGKHASTSDTQEMLTLEIRSHPC